MQYKSTIRACFAGYVVQAVVNNFVPLLFLTFQSQYGIPLSQVTLLITINFALQLAVDGVSVFFIDRIGYRAAAVIAHICATLGLVGLAFLPDLLPSPFAGLLLSVLLYALGGGLLEVIVSPIVESCPSDHKAQTMSILHSFYCWGSAGVIVISTLFLKIFGASSWKILAAIWAPLVAEGGTGMHIGQLFRSRVFWVIMLMMLCAGASEQAVSQWASTFAEKGLGVSKAVGDLAGPTVFALLMATSRLLYGKFGAKIDLNKAMMASALLCVVSYLLIGLTNSPVLGLVGVGLCGLAVGIFWPGTFSTAAASLRGGGTAMFALMALAGDLGCSGGPTLAGAIAGAFGDNLRLGILCAVAFPALMILGILLIRRTDAKV